jgi:hypothetical protein
MQRTNSFSLTSITQFFYLMNDSTLRQSAFQYWPLLASGVTVLLSVGEVESFTNEESFFSALTDVLPPLVHPAMKIMTMKVASTGFIFTL